jgi:hypothetical protein
MNSFIDRPCESVIRASLFSLPSSANETAGTSETAETICFGVLSEPYSLRLAL